MFSPQDILAIESELCRRSFRDFVIAGWSTFNSKPLILDRPQEALIATLQAVGDGRLGESFDLVINEPPSHGKTSLLTAWQGWMWARNPAESFVVASHTAKFAAIKAVEFQDLINSTWFRAHFKIDLRTDNVMSILNTQHGKRDCTGVDGSITGLHYNYQLIDDIVDAKRSDNPEAIAFANSWLNSTLSTRWAAGTKTKRIFISQRLATTDVAADVIANPRARLFHLVLPIYATDSKAQLLDVKGKMIWQDDRSPGDLLAPKLFDREFIEGARRQMRAVKFAAQFMQAPVKSGTGITDPAWLNHTYDIAPTFDKIIMMADTAITGHNDPIALLVAGILGSKAYLLECVNDRYTQLETIGQIEELESRYNINEIVIEKAASGVGVAEVLAQTRSNVVFISHGGKSKLERYKNSTIALESGSVLFPQTGFEGFKELILAFPNKTIPDECVDVLAYLIQRYLLKPPEDIQAITAGMMQLLD